MEVSQGEVPLYILGRIILLRQRMEELENVKFIWTFWSHINVHLPLHIAHKSLVKLPFHYVDVFKITHAQTHPLKQCNKQRWRSLSRIFPDFQHCIRWGGVGGGGWGGGIFQKTSLLCAGTQKLQVNSLRIPVYILYYGPTKVFSKIVPLKRFRFEGDFFLYF